VLAGKGGGGLTLKEKLLFLSLLMLPQRWAACKEVQQIANRKFAGLKSLLDHLTFAELICRPPTFGNDVPK
jgi:hypothetical protein